MGNLVRGSKKILVNTCNASIFGVYQDADGVNVLVHKPTGIHIPGLDTADVNRYNRKIAFGTTYAGVKGSILLDLFAPYPSDTENYPVILNLQRIGKRQGGIDSWRSEARPYAWTLPSLGAVSSGEINSTDKMTAMKEIVTQINNDRERFADAGMVFVVENDDYDDATVIKITLQNGVEYTITTATTLWSLASVINNTTGLKDYVKAYGATKSAANNERVIIESIVPCFFTVEAVTDATVIAAYLRLDNQEDIHYVVAGSGSSNVQWRETKYSKWTADTSGCAADADDGDFTMTISSVSTAFSFNVTSSVSDALKALNIAQQLCNNGGISGLPTSVYIGALDTDDVVEIISIGDNITDMSPAEAADKVTFEETPLKFRWPRLTTADMNDIFPNGPGNEFQYIDSPVQNADYAMLDLKWDVENYDNVTVDGIIQKRGHIQFYILKSLLPATYSYSATDKDWWKVNASVATNFMDDSPVSPNLHFWDLLAKWNGDVSLATVIDPDGTGIGNGIVE